MIEDELRKMARARIKAVITPALVAEVLKERIERITLEEAMVQFRFTDRDKFRSFLREHGIQVRDYSQRHKYILVKDIENADERYLARQKDAEAREGTKIVCLQEKSAA